MKTAGQKLLEFYHGICDASMHILSVGMELSGLLFILSIIFHFTAGAYTYQIRVQQIAASCCTGALAVFIAALSAACAADIISKSR
ncbi:MAG TPA: hypothetical protein DEQ02_09045, partial [Ruminococcaceae bacterium]|nr:hypothetical protein [Oscillospiraceae bacterium]